MKHLLALTAILTFALHSFGKPTVALNKTDAIILEESNTIDISSRKLAFMHFHFSKTMKVVILSEKGADFYKTITLPENYDPTYIYHSPKMRNYHYALSDVKFKDFKVLKINGNDTTEKSFELSDTAIVMVNQDREFGKYYKQKCTTKDISVGDTLLISYYYDAKYISNFSVLSCFRIFLHSNVYKEKYNLTVKHSKNLRTEFTVENFTNTEKLDTTDDIVSHSWDAEKLEPCISEKGSRPYTELPNITVIAKPTELIYTIPASWREAYLPFYVFPVSEREDNHFSILEAIKDGVRTKQYMQVYEFVEKHTKDVSNDTIGYITLQKLHNAIVDDFDFHNDYDYFSKQDVRRDRIGDFLTKETLRDINRYDTYVAIILKAGLGYLTAYPLDKRVGKISENYFRSMFDSDFFIAAILNNNVPQFILPKRHEFGYYLNEFPFYFENSDVRLISLFDYIVYKRAVNDAFRVIKTPASKLKDNVRTTNALVKISMESLITEFMTKVNLAGQYSTVTRGIYQHDYKDETVNPLYNKKVWEINDDVELINSDFKVSKRIFPFNAALSASYKSNTLLKKTGDTYTLNLKNWFNHIIYPNFNAENRQMDFYTDFMGRDTYNYMLQFDKDVELTNPMQKVSISNDFAELIIEITQLSPKQIRISSVYSIITDKVPAEKIKDVKAVFDKIEALNDYILKLKGI